MENISAYLQKLPFIDKLTDEQKRFLAANAVTRRFNRGELIRNGDDSCLGMVFVISGCLRVYLLSEEGREVTLFRVSQGEICVLSASCVISQITFDTHIVVEHDCELLVVNSCAFGKITDENIYARCFMYELAAERFSSVMWTLQQILFFGFDRRLAGFLVDEYDKTGNKTISMTHEQIAQRVNSAREVVARMLKRFASDGLVQLKRGAIVICDTEALRKIK